jgi:hypothetical protein
MQEAASSLIAIAYQAKSDPPEATGDYENMGLTRFSN